MYKSKVQEVCQEYGWSLPEYTAVKEGPDHNPRFTATVTVNGVSFESPKDQCCRSSKEAQNLAAHIAYHHFTSGSSTVHQLSPLPRTRSRRDAKGVLHLYKNRLQHYAQKKNLTLPAYSSELDGPPHARRFRSKVTVDGKTYETQEFFSTLKEAEHAAAEVAFESLALNDIQEDEGLYKTLLQELAQKEGLLFPVYNTARTGAPHTPTFQSTVEVGGGTFQGEEAKTKKQAEMNAAKVAYSALTKCGHLDEPLKVLPASSGYAAGDVSEPVVQQKLKLAVEEANMQKEEADTHVKRHRWSTAPDTYSVIRDPCPAASCSPDNLSSTSAVLDHSTESLVESSTDSGTFAGTSTLTREKIFIFPQNARVELPKGASVMSYSDAKWVAASLQLHPNQ